MDLVQVKNDIVREYCADIDSESAWDSDFALRALPQEMVAYAMSFHGLAPDYRRATLMVAEFSSLFDEDFSEWFWEKLVDNGEPLRYEAEVFALLCVAIYAQSVEQISAREGS